MYKISFILFVFILFKTSCFAQCGFTINSFPYVQDFETSTGAWVSGGTGNDWAWGSPSKLYITNAGSGTKCWVTGGLSGSFYNFGERSYVTSPCFDFSTLTYPVISFKIYWECENTYDGATFQSSIDGGITWTNVGSNTDPTNCMTQNWFNNANITNLSSLANPKCGWAGTILPSSGSCQGGGGSNGWLIAKHCLSNLAGQSSVRFRFAFGAGTFCNDFDGFAFDNIKIENATANLANFSYTCTSTPFQYQFSNLSLPCPDNNVWNFGDPASGINNGTGLLNPTHTFSSPGTYTVTLTASGPCNGSSTISKVISTIDLSLSASNVSCANSMNGLILANAINGSGTSLYTLQPLGTTNTNGNFSGLNQGTYTISVTDAIGCSISSTTSITSPPMLNWNLFNATNISCHGLQDGKINTQVSGGSGSINYTLMPGSILSSSGSYTNLSAGTYTIIAADANGCSVSSTASITDPNALTIIVSTHQNILCNNANDGTIQLNCIGGTGSLSYQINPGGTINSTGLFTNLAAGLFTVVCSDANNCSMSSTYVLTEPSVLIIDSINIKAPGCNPNNDGTATVYASGGSMPLQYSIGGSFGSNNQFTSMTSNTYTVIVKDANACSISSIITLQSINAPIFTSITTKNVSCYENLDGSIVVTAAGNAPIQNYSLSPTGSTNINGNFAYLAADTYVVTVSDINGCTNTTSIVLSSPEKLVINKLEYISDSCGSQSSGRLLCYAIGGTSPYSYILNPGGLQQTNMLFTDVGIGDFVVKVIDANNCSTISSIFIPEKICCEEIFVPNAFSPNNDGKNDEFGLKGINGIDQIEFLIFNRWGQLVFKAQNNTDTWNGHYLGSEADMGTYFYLVRYRCITTGKKYLVKGDLILVR